MLSYQSQNNLLKNAFKENEIEIAKQIIEIHGGSIKAENRLNKFNKIEGARFIISFKQIQKKAI